MQAREPQGPIQKAPAGLLGLLGLKQSGATPNSLAGSVQATVDALPFFLSNPRIQLKATGTAAAGNENGLRAFTVPPIPAIGEIWVISRGTVQVGVAPGESIGFVAPVQVHNNGTAFELIGENIGPIGTAGAGGRIVLAALEPGLILTAGYEIQVLISDAIGATGPSVELYLDYNVFPL